MERGQTFVRRNISGIPDVCYRRSQRENVAAARVAKRRDSQRNACSFGQREASKRRAPLYLEARVAAV